MHVYNFGITHFAFIIFVNLANITLRNTVSLNRAPIHSGLPVPAWFILMESYLRQFYVP